MNYWLMKCEPDAYSFQDLKKDKLTCWEGVRNYQARNFMREMKKGDFVLFYHSNCIDKGVIGIAKVCKEAYPDHYALDKSHKYFDKRCSAEKNLWSMVDVKFHKALARLVSLEEIKSTRSLQKMRLVQKGNRLSIFPITENEFNVIVKKGNSL